MKNHIAIAIQHMRRAPYQAIAAIGICAMTFFMAGIFSVVAIGTSVILDYFESRPQVTTFFKEDTTEEQINSLQQKVEQTGLTIDVKFVSKEEALSIYREQNKNDPLLLEMVTANILPASLEIQAKDTDSLKKVAELVKGEDSVEEVLFQEDIIVSLEKWSRSVRIIGITLVGILSALALVVILVIVGMKISMKRDEIEILYLIGATRGYIRAPFLIEGMLYGFIGAFWAWVFIVIALLYATPFLVTFLAGLPVLPVPMWFYGVTLASILGFGIMFGTVGSFLAVKRYLR
jgi:cell division transport system permease protein